MLFIYMLYTSVEHSTVFWPMLQLEFMQIYLLWKPSLYVHLRSHRVRQSKCQKLWLLKEPRTGLGCSLQCQQDVSYWLKHKVNEINGHCSPKKAKKQCRFFFFFFLPRSNNLWDILDSTLSIFTYKAQSTGQFATFYFVIKIIHF